MFLLDTIETVTHQDGVYKTKFVDLYAQHIIHICMKNTF